MNSSAQIVIAVDEAGQDQVLRAVAAAHGIPALSVPIEQTLEAAVAAMASSHASRLWIVDLAWLHRDRLLPAQLTVLMRRVHPSAWLLFSDYARLAVDGFALSWARQRGAMGLIPSLSPERYAGQIEPLLRPAIEMLGVAWRRAPVMSFLANLAGGGSRPLARVLEHRQLAAFEAQGSSLETIAAWAGGPDGFDVRDRVWRGTTYRSVFVGRDATAALMLRWGLSRDDAVALGRVLLRARVFQHALKEHDFKDDELFYRFTPITPKLERLSLTQLIAHATGRDGFELRDRLHLGRSYPRCFIGSEAAEWLQARYSLSEDKALVAGQAMMDLGLFAHVLNEHEFKNGNFFYAWRGFALEMVPGG